MLYIYVCLYDVSQVQNILEFNRSEHSQTQYPLKSIRKLFICLDFRRNPNRIEFSSSNAKRTVVHGREWFWRRIYHMTCWFTSLHSTAPPPEANRELERKKCASSMIAQSIVQGNDYLWGQSEEANKNDTLGASIAMYQTFFYFAYSACMCIAPTCSKLLYFNIILIPSLINFDIYNCAYSRLYFWT